MAVEATHAGVLALGLAAQGAPGLGHAPAGGRPQSLGWASDGTLWVGGERVQLPPATSSRLRPAKSLGAGDVVVLDLDAEEGSLRVLINGACLATVLGPEERGGLARMPDLGGRPLVPVVSLYHSADRVVLSGAGFAGSTLWAPWPLDVLRSTSVWAAGLGRALARGAAFDEVHRLEPFRKALERGRRGGAADPAGEPGEGGAGAAGEAKAGAAVFVGEAKTGPAGSVFEAKTGPAGSVYGAKTGPAVFVSEAKTGPSMFVSEADSGPAMFASEAGAGAAAPASEARTGRAAPARPLAARAALLLWLGGEGRGMHHFLAIEAGAAMALARHLGCSRAADRAVRHLAPRVTGAVAPEDWDRAPPGRLLGPLRAPPGFLEGAPAVPPRLRRAWRALGELRSALRFKRQEARSEAARRPSLAPGLEPPPPPEGGGGGAGAPPTPTPTPTPPAPPAETTDLDESKAEAPAAAAERKEGVGDGGGVGVGGRGGTGVPPGPAPPRRWESAFDAEAARVLRCVEALEGFEGLPEAAPGSSDEDEAEAEEVLRACMRLLKLGLRGDAAGTLELLGGGWVRAWQRASGLRLLRRLVELGRPAGGGARCWSPVWDVACQLRLGLEASGGGGAPLAFLGARAEEVRRVREEERAVAGALQGAFAALLRPEASALSAAALSTTMHALLSATGALRAGDGGGDAFWRALDPLLKLRAPASPSGAPLFAVEPPGEALLRLGLCHSAESLVEPSWLRHAVLGSRVSVSMLDALVRRAERMRGALRLAAALDPHPPHPHPHPTPPARISALLARYEEAFRGVCALQSRQYHGDVNRLRAQAKAVGRSLRRRRGVRYTYVVTAKNGIGVRHLPHPDSERVGMSLAHKEVVEVSQAFSPAGAGGQTYLRMASGRGWLFTKGVRGNYKDKAIMKCLLAEKDPREVAEAAAAELLTRLEAPPPASHGAQGDYALLENRRNGAVVLRQHRSWGAGGRVDLFLQHGVTQDAIFSSDQVWGSKGPTQHLKTCYLEVEVGCAGPLSDADAAPGETPLRLRFPCVDVGWSMRGAPDDARGGLCVTLGQLCYKALLSRARRAAALHGPKDAPARPLAPTQETAAAVAGAIPETLRRAPRRPPANAPEAAEAAAAAGASDGPGDAAEGFGGGPGYEEWPSLLREGDVVGCGVVGEFGGGEALRKVRVFFTLNGEELPCDAGGHYHLPEEDLARFRAGARLSPVVHLRGWCTIATASLGPAFRFAPGERMLSLPARRLRDAIGEQYGPQPSARQRRLTPGALALAEEQRRAAEEAGGAAPRPPTPSSAGSDIWSEATDSTENSHAGAELLLSAVELRSLQQLSWRLFAVRAARAAQALAAGAGGAAPAAELRRGIAVCVARLDRCMGCLLREGEGHAADDLDVVYAASCAAQTLRLLVKLAELLPRRAPLEALLGRAAAEDAAVNVFRALHCASLPLRTLAAELMPHLLLAVPERRSSRKLAALLRPPQAGAPPAGVLHAVVLTLLQRVGALLLGSLGAAPPAAEGAAPAPAAAFGSGDVGITTASSIRRLVLSLARAEGGRSIPRLLLDECAKLGDAAAAAPADALGVRFAALWVLSGVELVCEGASVAVAPLGATGTVLRMRPGHAEASVAVEAPALAAAVAAVAAAQGAPDARAGRLSASLRELEAVEPLVGQVYAAMGDEARALARPALGAVVRMLGALRAGAGAAPAPVAALCEVLGVGFLASLHARLGLEGRDAEQLLQVFLRYAAAAPPAPAAPGGADPLVLASNGLRQSWARLAEMPPARAPAAAAEAAEPAERPPAGLFLEGEAAQALLLARLRAAREAGDLSPSRRNFCAFAHALAVCVLEDALPVLEGPGAGAELYAAPRGATLLVCGAVPCGGEDRVALALAGGGWAATALGAGAALRQVVLPAADKLALPSRRPAAANGGGRGLERAAWVEGAAFAFSDVPPTQLSLRRILRDAPAAAGPREQAEERGRLVLLTPENFPRHGVRHRLHTHPLRLLRPADRFPGRAEWTCQACRAVAPMQAPAFCSTSPAVAPWALCYNCFLTDKDAAHAATVAAHAAEQAMARGAPHPDDAAAGAPPPDDAQDPPDADAPAAAAPAAEQEPPAAEQELLLRVPWLQDGGAAAAAGGALRSRARRSRRSRGATRRPPGAAPSSCAATARRTRRRTARRTARAPARPRAPRAPAAPGRARRSTRGRRSCSRSRGGSSRRWASRARWTRSCGPRSSRSSAPACAASRRWSSRPSSSSRPASPPASPSSPASAWPRSSRRTSRRRAPPRAAARPGAAPTRPRPRRRPRAARTTTPAATCARRRTRGRPSPRASPRRTPSRTRAAQARTRRPSGRARPRRAAGTRGPRPRSARARTGGSAARRARPRGGRRRRRRRGRRCSRAARGSRRCSASGARATTRTAPSAATTRSTT